MEIPRSGLTEREDPKGPPHESISAREAKPQTFQHDGLLGGAEAVRTEGGTPCIPLDQMHMREPPSQEPSMAKEQTGTHIRPNLQPTPRHKAVGHSSDTSTREQATTTNSYRKTDEIMGAESSERKLAPAGNWADELPSSSQRPVERHSWEPTAVNIQGTSDDSACASPHNINLDSAAELASEHAQGGDSVPTGATTQDVRYHGDQWSYDQHMRAQTVEQRCSETTGVKPVHADSDRGTSRKVHVDIHQREQSTTPDRASVTSKAAEPTPLPWSREGDMTRPKNKERVGQHQESSDSDCFAKPVQGNKSNTQMDSEEEIQFQQPSWFQNTIGVTLQTSEWAHYKSTAQNRFGDEESQALRGTINGSSAVTTTDDETRPPSRLNKERFNKRIAECPEGYFQQEINYPHFVQYLDYALVKFERRYLDQGTTMHKETRKLKQLCQEGRIELSIEGQANVANTLWAVHKFLGTKALGMPMYTTHNGVNCLTYADSNGKYEGLWHSRKKCLRHCPYTMRTPSQVMMISMT